MRGVQSKRREKNRDYEIFLFFSGINLENYSEYAASFPTSRLPQRAGAGIMESGESPEHLPVAVCAGAVSPRREPATEGKTLGR